MQQTNKQLVRFEKSLLMTMMSLLTSEITNGKQRIVFYMARRFGQVVATSDKNYRDGQKH